MRGMDSPLMSALTHSDGRPFGMGKRSYVRMVDARAFRGWVAERNVNAGVESDDEGAMAYICAQRASGVPLKMVADHFLIDFGLLYDFAYQTPERCERMARAEKGGAEYYAGEIVEIADAIDPETGRPDPMADVKRDALRVKVRTDLMKAHDREKYGSDEAKLGADLNNLASVLKAISERKQRALSAPQAEIEDAVIVEAAPAEEVPEKPVLAVIDTTKYDGPAPEGDYL